MQLFGIYMYTNVCQFLAISTTQFLTNFYSHIDQMHQLALNTLYKEQQRK